MRTYTRAVSCNASCTVCSELSGRAASDLSGHNAMSASIAEQMVYLPTLGTLGGRQGVDLGGCRQAFKGLL